MNTVVDRDASGFSVFPETENDDNEKVDDKKVYDEKVHDKKVHDEKTDDKHHDDECIRLEDLVPYVVEMSTDYGHSYDSAPVALAFVMAWNKRTESPCYGVLSPRGRRTFANFKACREGGDEIASWRRVATHPHLVSWMRDDFRDAIAQSITISLGHIMGSNWSYK